MTRLFRVFAGAVLVLGIFTVQLGASGASDDSASADKPVAGRSIVDQNGTTVVLPEKIERVVLTALPLPSIFALTGAPLDMIVGMHPGSKSAIANSVMNDMYPGLADRETGFIEGTDINIEALLNLQPDLVIYWGAYSNQTKQFKEAGIPAIGVGTQGKGNALLTLSTWLDIMGEVFDRKGETGRVIDYGNKTMEAISAKVDKLSGSDKPRSLFLFKHGEEVITVPGKGHYGDWWISSTGGVNVASSIDVTANVNMEQIYEWNPEIIFISSFTPTMPEDLYSNSIAGQDWSSVSAVKNRRVYKVPVGVYRWYPPSGDVPLMMKWMAQKQHPELFKYDMVKEIQSYYSEFYGYSLDTAGAEKILNTAKEASQGTGGLNIQKK